MAFIQTGRVIEEEQSSDEQNAHLLLTCMLDGRWAEAALLLPELLEEENQPDVLFNAAIVYLRADTPERALDQLEQALAALERTRHSPRSAKGVIYRALRAKEIADFSYLNPVRASQIEHFSAIVNENILLALSDVALKCGLTSRAAAYAASLVGEEFNDFKARILTAARQA
jgi:Flp pilus assembly protein TadD